ncbi:MAG TPA: hypothetical protein PKV71_02445 [Calditrichia bacterium]|nr:hypothetical protein [Calditrichia bacterium]
MKNLLILMAFLGLTLSAQAQVAVVVNKNVAESSLPKETVKKIFELNQLRWGNGDKIAVFDMKGDGPSKDKFYEALGVSVSDLRKIWMRMQLTGEAKAPKGVKSDAEVIQQVSTTPGAIGFVMADQATDAVKVVLTLP